jgi:mono/diheme cytochrome c family protein
MKYSQFLRTLYLTLCSGILFLAPQTFAAEVASGAEIINNNCARCHNSRPIQEFSIQEWSVIMPHMREKAHLTGKETEAVMEFLKTISSVPDKNTADDVAILVMNGGELMAKYGCQGCHSFNGQGGALGPPLDNTVELKGADFVIKKLTDPQFNNPTSAMPKMPLTVAEIDALVDFLKRKK